MLPHQLKPCHPPEGLPSVAVQRPSMSLLCHIGARFFSLPGSRTSHHLKYKEPAVVNMLGFSCNTTTVHLHNGFAVEDE